MKTSTSTRTWHRRKTKTKGGFSLLEILIALTVMGVMLTLAVKDGVSQRDKLERALEQLGRAINFAQAETVFRGSLVRIHFILGPDARYHVEIGPSGRFVIPLDPYQDQTSLSLSERAAQEKRQKKLNLDFHPAENFPQRRDDFVAPISLVAVVTDKLKQPQTAGEASVYFTPQGENDAALIMLANDVEMGVLKLEPYTLEQTIEYFPLAENASGDLDWQTAIDQKIEEIFRKWQ